MLIYLICLLWGHKTVHKATTGAFDTTNPLTGLPQKGHYYRFTRTLFCTRCGKPGVAESKEGDWSFESDEQIAAFTAFFSRVAREDSEDIGIALRNPRSPLQVITSNYVARRMAQAFHFGWMIALDLQKGKQVEASKTRHKI